MPNLRNCGGYGSSLTTSDGTTARSISVKFAFEKLDREKPGCKGATFGCE